MIEKHVKKQTIELDGAAGGGQILRSALSLSLVTGRAFRLTSIRGKRPKPGLMRQHLTCVLAAVEVSGGVAEGAELGSQEIVFRPGTVAGGDYHFAIGTAGSTTLLAQTLLPAFWGSGKAVSLTLEGGTHNPMAPPVEFLQRTFLPMVGKMGGAAELELIRPGFAPAGGGMIQLHLPEGTRLRPIEVLERGELLGQRLECALAHVKESVARREIGEALNGLAWDRDCAQVIDMSQSSGAGNVLAAEIVFENVSERVTAFGAYGKRAKQVAREVAKGIQDYLGSGAVVGRRLGDQLLLPMALAGGGKFVTMAPSNHLLTNAVVIEAFLPLSVSIEERGRGACLVSVRTLNGCWRSPVNLGPNGGASDQFPLHMGEGVEGTLSSLLRWGLGFASQVLGGTIARGGDRVEDRNRGGIARLRAVLDHLRSRLAATLATHLGSSAKQPSAPQSRT